MTLSRWLLAGAMLYPAYLYQSYDWLNNYQTQSRFYVSTAKPRTQCFPEPH